MAKTSINEQKHQRTQETRHAVESKVSTPHDEEPLQRIIKEEVLPKKRSEATYQTRERQADGRHQMETRRENILGREDVSKHNVAKASELSNNSYKPPLYKDESIQKREDRDNYLHKRQQKADRRAYEDNFAEEAIKVNKASHGKPLESTDSQFEAARHRQEKASERDVFKTLSPQKHDQLSIINGISSPSNVNNELAENIHVRSTRKMQDVTDGLMSNFRGGIPPPYVKPIKSKHKADAEENDTLTFYPSGNDNRAEKLPTKKPDYPDARENGDNKGSFTEIYYKEESGIDSTPRRRSHRKKPSRSSSNQDMNVNGGDSGKEERVVRRVSTSRRKHESRKGLQVIFDDDHYEKDDEEKMIDKLLLHYSKKPSSSDSGKPRRESKKKTNDGMKSPVYKATVFNDDNEEDLTPSKETCRSMSLPPLQVTQPESQKVFTRAASFQQETPAKHVHPKLPDYDDLAARFAALRATKG